MSHEQAEALDFRRVQALQKHTEQLWGTLGVYCTGFYICTCIPKHFSVYLQIQIQEMESPSQQCIFLPASVLCTCLK